MAPQNTGTEYGLERGLRFAIWGVALVVIALAGAMSLGLVPLGGMNQANVGTIGGPFTLVNTDGKTVTDADFKGKARAMFFGFTHCPDVCPTTLADAGNWLNGLGDKAKDIDFIFVSVDPSRDTPQQMKDYLSAFDPRIIGLTGSQAEIDKAVKEFRVYARKVETGNGEYTMDHSAAVLLFDRNGTFAGTVDFNDPEDKAIAKLAKVVS